MRFARFLLCSFLPFLPPLSLGTSSVCCVCFVCVYFVCVYFVCVFFISLLFFRVNFAVEFCMLHSRTESFLVLHLISILALSLLFCFVLPLQTVLFLKNGCRITSIVFLSVCLSLYLHVCVLGVCHKDLCVAIYTHSQKTVREREKKEEREGGSRTKNKAKRLFHAYIEWKAEKPPLVGKWQR